MGNIPTITVASDHTIYLAWLEYDVWAIQNAQLTGQIYMRKSIDGGANFTDCTTSANADEAVATINLPPYMLKAMVDDGTGTYTYPNDIVAKGNSGTPIAVNPNNPSELYIAYAADPDGASLGSDEANIYLIKSTDGGDTWGSAVLINDDGGITDQAFPWIDIKPDGTIDVAWYDKRNSADDDAWDVYIAKSTDSGVSFSTNYRISDTTAQPGSFAEYLGLATDSTTAYVAFAQRSLTDPGDIWFDSVANSAIPEPATLALLFAGGLLLSVRRRK